MNYLSFESIAPLLQHSDTPILSRAKNLNEDILNQENFYTTLRGVLAARSPKLIQDKELSYAHAAVMIPLFSENGEYKILFTKRTHKVEHHKDSLQYVEAWISHIAASVQG